MRVKYGESQVKLPKLSLLGIICSFFFFLRFLKTYLFERKRVCVCEYEQGGGAEGEGEADSVLRDGRRAPSQGPEIMI